MFRLLSHALGDRQLDGKKLGAVMKSIGTNRALTGKMVELDRKCGGHVDAGFYSSAWGAMVTDILKNDDFSVADIIAVNAKTMTDAEDKSGGDNSDDASKPQGKDTQAHVVSFRKLMEFPNSHIELDESLKGKSEVNVFASDVLSTLQLAIQSDMLTTARLLG